MKALLVDDSKAARFAMRNLLEKQGLEVTMAASGEEALESLTEDLVDIIFMDQSMPGMGGIEATRKILGTDTTAHIPIVLCTGNEGSKLEVMAEEAGAIGVLTKPPKAEKLAAVLAQVAQAGDAPETVAEEVADTAPVAETAAATGSVISSEELSRILTNIEDLQARVTELEQLESKLTTIVEDKSAANLKLSESKLKPMQDSLDKVSGTITTQVKEQLTMDTSNQRIQLEGLRQQVEAGLDDMQEREVNFRKTITEELEQSTQETISSSLDEQKTLLEEHGSSLKSDVEDQLSSATQLVKGIKGSILIKSALIAIAAAAGAFFANQFFG